MLCFFFFIIIFLFVLPPGRALFKFVAFTKTPQKQKLFLPQYEGGIINLTNESKGVLQQSSLRGFLCKVAE